VGAAALLDIEPEYAVGTVVVFPAAMGLGKIVVANCLDSIVEAHICGSWIAFILRRLV
jgi:hypothetical protein